jgi:hypothetical protein
MQKRFLEDVMLFIIKIFLPLRTVESIWFQRLALQLCPKVSFSSKKAFTKEVLPSMVVATLTLGSQPKPRGYKGAGQKKAQESHHILPGV